MKDLSLSLLSRGCGRFVSSNKNTWRHDGRLEVCFTPQDYYIWKSQESLLHLSNSGHLLVEAESTLPKTYSTRRGPLLLYSQDLVTVETNCGSETENRKKRVVRRYTQQVEQQLSTLKELTAAILSYTNNQYTSSQLAPPLFPPLHFPPVPDRHCPNPLPICPTQAQPRPESLVQLNPQWLPAEKNTERENQPEDKEEELGSRNKVRLDLLLQIPCTSKTPTPQPWVHYIAITPEEPEEPQTYLDMSLQTTESSHHTEIRHHNTEGELHHPNINYVHDVADDRGCSIQRNIGTTGDKGYDERSTSGNRHVRIGKVVRYTYFMNISHVLTFLFSISVKSSLVRLCGAEKQSRSNTEPETNATSGISGLLLPPLNVGHSVCYGPCWEKTDRLRWESSESVEHHAQHLPPIAESRTVAPARVVQVQTQQDVQPRAEKDGFQSQESLNRLHQQALILPLMFPKKEEEMSGKQRRGGEKTESRWFKKQRAGRGGGGVGGGRLPSEKGSVVLLDPGAEPLPPVGVLGCVAGRKGPGKQSSLAFLQNRLLDLQDPCESSDANRGVVRGVLPLELRDLQNGKSVGSLLLGPDGEIIQLSLYDNSQGPSQGDDDAQQQALQVLSSEGETLPWVIVLQSEHTHTEGGVELNTDDVGNTQHHQPMHQRTESHISDGQFTTGEHSCSTEQLLDLHSLTGTNACSPTGLTDRATVRQKKTKSAVASRGTWKKPKKAAKNCVRMPPLREWVGREEPRGGDAQTEEEGEEEELAMAGQTNHLSGSHRPGQQNISPTEAPTEKAADRKRKNIRRQDAEGAAATSRNGEMKTVKTTESDGQRTSKTSKEGRQQRQKAEGHSQPIRRQKQEERTNRDEAETQDHHALSSVKNKRRDGEGDRGEVKINGEREEREGRVMSQKEVSAGRRRRRQRLKHKELVVGNQEDPLEKEEVEIIQEMEEESQLKSAKRTYATQEHSNKTKTHSEEDTETDHHSTSDEHSSVRSVSSLRSSNASSQFYRSSSRRSAASSCEGAVPASAMGLASACGRLSSCSTVMVTDEQLMLNPVKPELSRSRRSQAEEESAALHLAQRAERRRQEVERKRREREEREREQEERERQQQEREQTEEKMKSELEEERRKRAEELRQKKLAEEEERRRHEEEEQERVRREQAQRERERRMQEERRRQMERLQRMREEEEQRRKAELERLQLEEQRRQEEENKKLQEMDESERIEYLRRKVEEEEDRRKREEECKRIEEEAAMLAAEEARLQAELLAREMAQLQQQLAFKRGLVLEAGGLEKTQGISRPWIYSYFTLLQVLGLNPAETTT
ncbi:uncharacterized protein KIAA2012 homolog isoform X3 [Trachinotus anak]|uniref:uncharacterized protein KIAA2012 homolog isoform X3 n=1 Tax=Trachinotus anak TaxID=443729 RepID=UPI0039F1FF7C